MATDNNLPTESELTLEEAAEAVLANEPDEDQSYTTEMAEEAILPAVSQPSTVSMRNILDLMHNAHEASMTRTDSDCITKGLWYLI